uniref:Secreted protein n=1 Tax=Plectus sambesii TaxID=2011161 RepID=A0A914W9N2_9BILA
MHFALCSDVLFVWFGRADAAVDDAAAAADGPADEPTKSRPEFSPAVTGDLRLPPRTPTYHQRSLHAHRTLDRNHVYGAGGAGGDSRHLPACSRAIADPRRGDGHPIGRQSVSQLRRGRPYAAVALVQTLLSSRAQSDATHSYSSPFGRGKKPTNAAGLD